MLFSEQYEVVIVGAGHAGCEAAMACARMGLKTALFTLNLDLIAQMSCNPAVGGIAKGHLVREVDALGGVMGEVTDAVGIQFRLLNTSRGPAVWSPRAQCDKQQYRLKMREVFRRRNWMPTASVTSPMMPPSASTSRTRWPLAMPPTAGLHDICAIKSRLSVNRAVFSPRRAAAMAASHPACPAPTTTTSYCSLNPTL